MVAKKNDGIKESTDSSTTIEDEDTRGKLSPGRYTKTSFSRDCFTKTSFPCLLYSFTFSMLLLGAALCVCL